MGNILNTNKTELAAPKYVNTSLWENKKKDKNKFIRGPDNEMNISFFVSEISPVVILTEATENSTEWGLTLSSFINNKWPSSWPTTAIIETESIPVLSNKSRIATTDIK